MISSCRNVPILCLMANRTFLGLNTVCVARSSLCRASNILPVVFAACRIIRSFILTAHGTSFGFGSWLTTGRCGRNKLPFMGASCGNLFFLCLSASSYCTSTNPYTWVYTSRLFNDFSRIPRVLSVRGRSGRIGKIVRSRLSGIKRFIRQRHRHQADDHHQRQKKRRYTFFP